jgi:hypothetical protein
VEDAAALLQRQTPAQLVQALKAVLPTQLTSLHVSFSRETITTLGAPFCAALPVLSQLTELWIQHGNEPLDFPLGVLAALPHLRKLRAGYINWNPQLLAEVKQLSQLRDLSIQSLQSNEIVALCQPPHVFQLERIALPGTYLYEGGMRALSQLPLLTSLELGCIKADAIPWLRKLTLLRRLTGKFESWMTSERTLSLSKSLSACNALTDLSLQFWFDDEITDEQRHTRWTGILQSIPNVRRLRIGHLSMAALLAVLPLQLPMLEHLWLRCWDRMDPVAFLAQLAHPSVRQIELRSIDIKFPEEPVRALVHSARLPMLERIDCPYPPEDEPPE